MNPRDDMPGYVPDRTKDAPVVASPEMGLPPEDVMVPMDAPDVAPPHKGVPVTYDYMVRSVTTNVLEQYADDPDVSVEDIGAYVLEGLSKAIYEHKQGKIGKRHPWPIPSSLLPVQIAMIMAARCHICVLKENEADPDKWQLAIYQEATFPNGMPNPDEGTWATSDDAFRRIASQIDHAGLSIHKFEEIMFRLRDMVPQLQASSDPDLVAVDNGIFDFRRKVLMPFTPEHIFLAKSRVPYEDKWDHMPAPTFTNADGTIWDLDSWLLDISNDEQEISQLLWEVVSAILRPNVVWGRIVFLYSEVGNNGKGTFCQLLRNLCGPGVWTSLPLDKMGDQFALESLLHANAIIVDENNVDQYIDKAANIKTIVTNDVLFVDRKNKPALAFRFHGLMVQCINSYPRIKDKTDSWYRRNLIIKFERSYTGCQNSDIKNVYLNDPELLSYAMWRAMHMSHDDLSEPASCLMVLDDYKMFNDPVRQFVDEVIMRETRWSLLPYGFLYDLYSAWWKANSPEGKLLGKRSFKKQLVMVMRPMDGWIADPDRKWGSAGRMDGPEPTIVAYGLKGWMRDGYRGANETMIATPTKLSQNYQGLVRENGEVHDDE